MGTDVRRASLKKHEQRFLSRTQTSTCMHRNESKTRCMAVFLLSFSLKRSGQGAIQGEAYGDMNFIKKKVLAIAFYGAIKGIRQNPFERGDCHVA